MSDYTRILVDRLDIKPGDSGELLFDNIEDGTYQVGILTYFQGFQVIPFRSDVNTNIFTCNVNASSSFTSCVQ